ncbi:hypothetical protein GCM10010406_21580 [Streptomyces thermolineatus]|uniref:Uncharacterized protein n=1 Tax=Streptomyces thermolineatus TaxID=44033 RepID=A0ABN3LLI7_9ACTN
MTALLGCLAVAAAVLLGWTATRALGQLAYRDTHPLEDFHPADPDRQPGTDIALLLTTEAIWHQPAANRRTP